MSDLHATRARIQTAALVRTPADHPVVVLQGARQTGKTTLARLPEIGAGRAYLTLDDLGLLDSARADPDALFLGRERITLDEVQREPDLLLAVKRAVDSDRSPGRFLLTGSANLLLMHRVSETLAGRAVYFRLPGLTRAEVEARPFGANLELLLRGGSLEAVASDLRSPDPPRRALPDAVLAGGYPVPALHADPSFRTRWYDGYVQTYLERDLRHLSATDSLVDFRRLMQITASLNGRLANVASMSRDAGLSPATARRYTGHLETSFQLLRIPAFAVKRGKRLVKSPLLFWSDTGLAAHLAGIAGVESRRSGREWGPWLEDWVAVHLSAFADLQSPAVSLCHWRTSSGREVDFVLETGRRLLPIEVKATARPGPADARALTSRVLALPIQDLLLA